MDGQVLLQNHLSLRWLVELTDRNIAIEKRNVINPYIYIESTLMLIFDQSKASYIELSPSGPPGYQSKLFFPRCLHATIVLSTRSWCPSTTGTDLLAISIKEEWNGH